MTTDYVMCCEQCFQEIAKNSTKAACLWLDLCMLHFTYGDTLRVCAKTECIEKLEKLGFLVSTEDDSKHILVRLNGYQLTGDSYFFCLKEGKHG